jgi:hypothetical protein
LLVLLHRARSYITNWSAVSLPGTEREGKIDGHGFGMIEGRLRPGYTALEAARRLALDSDGWLPFVQDVLQLPLSTLPAVRRVVRKGAWRYARDPLQSVRENAERDRRREIIANESGRLQPRQENSKRRGE